MRTPLASYQRFIAPFARPFARVVVSSLDLGRIWSVIDHGAGTGLVTKEIHARKPEVLVTAVDPSAELLEGLAGEPNCRIVHGTAEALVGSVTPVDAVVSNLVLSFCPDPESDLSILRSCAGHGGRLALLTLAGPDDVEPFRRYWDAVRAVTPDSWPVERYPHVRFPDAEVLAHLTRSAGWSHVRVEPVRRARTLTDRSAWSWLNSALPVGRNGGYRPLSTEEQVAVRERFLTSWGPRRRVVTTAWLVSAENA